MLNIKNVVRLLSREVELTDENEEVVSDYDKDACNMILELLGEMAASESHEFLQDTFLDIDRLRMEGSFKCIEVDEDPFDEEYQPELPTKRRTEEQVSFLRKKQIVDYWQNDGRKQRAFSCVQNRFREVQYRSQLYRWKEQIEAGGTRYSKLVELYHLTYEAFENARVVKRLPVHDLDLRRFALDAASKIGLQHFKASRSWIFKFKKTYNIVSRKVTKFITTKSMKNLEVTKAASKKFVADNKPIVEADPDSSINGDQSNFQREIRFGRVLEPKGTKVIDVIAQSANSLTHSSTVMPFITASGRLLEPVLLCIQEHDGHFPPTIEAKMKVPENLVVCASKSGKMEKRHVPLCLSKTVLPHCSTTAVTNLFLDSWSGHSDLSCIEELTRGTGINIDVKKLPPGTTDETQALDKFGFRPWKSFQRKISEFIILNEIDFKLGKRESIITLTSFVVRQLASPRYINMWKYAWHACGYLEDHPGIFDTPARFTFGHDETVCEIPSCKNAAMLRCSWCSKVQCFDHLIGNLHLCKDYVP